MDVKLGLLKEFFILEVWEFRVYKVWRKGQKFDLAAPAESGRRKACLQFHMLNF